MGLDRPDVRRSPSRVGTRDAGGGHVPSERASRFVVWVHQPYGYVAAIQGCPPYYADIWSEVSAVPVRRNIRQVGGGESWTAVELGVPSMLVEVGGTRREPIGVARHVDALEALLFAVQPT